MQTMRKTETKIFSWVLLFLLLGAGGVTAVIWVVFIRCPHCGAHLGREVGKHCPHCGKETGL